MNFNLESSELIKKEEMFKEFSNKILSNERRNASNNPDLQDKIADKLKFDITDVSLCDKIIEYISKLTVKREMIENELKKFNFKHKISLMSQYVNKNTVSQIENKLMDSLKKLIGFRQFLSFNGIDDDSLKMSLKNFGHIFLPKGCYIFRQEEISTHFYGILKGKISIRVNKIDKAKKREYNMKKEINSEFLKKLLHEKGRSTTLDINEDIKKKFKEKKDYIYEEERLVLKEGMCFGEWGLLYSKERTASAMAIEDCDLFCLDKDGFERSFGKKCIYKAEADRKNFVLKTIDFLKYIPKHKFDEIYKKIITVFKNKDEYLFKENNAAENIYLIYKGECKLTKMINKSEIVSTAPNINLRQIPNVKDKAIKAQRIEKTTTLISMISGDIAGAESFLGNGPRVYKYSLQTFTDFCILFQINVNIFYEFNNEMIKFFQDITRVKEDYLSKTIINNVIINEKTKITYKSLNKEGKSVNKEEKKSMKTNNAFNITSDNHHLFIDSKNTVKNHSEFLNVYWRDKVTSFIPKESLVNDGKKTSNSLDSKKNKHSTNFSKNEEKYSKLQEPGNTNILTKTERRSRNITKKSLSESKSNKSCKNSFEKPKETSHNPPRNQTFYTIMNKPNHFNNMNLLSTERVLKKNDSILKRNLNYMMSQDSIYNSGTFNLPLVSVKLKIPN